MRTDKDPTYIMLTDTAMAEVAEHGQFFKHDIIVKAGFGAHEEVIDRYLQWPIVKQKLEAKSGAMVSLGADNDSGWDPEIHPEKFLPGGKRRTIGYALASKYPRVAQEALRRDVAALGSRCKSMDAKVQSFQAQGVQITYTPATAPLLALPHVEAAE